MRREIIQTILWLFSVVLIMLSMIFLIGIKKKSDIYKAEDISSSQEISYENWSGTVSFNSLKNNNAGRYPVLAISSTILVLGIIFCVYLLIDYPSIDVYSYDLKGKLRKIGRIVAYKNGETIYVSIPRKMARLSETGQFQLQLNSDFVENNYNLIIVIKVGNKTYMENVKDKINIYNQENYGGLLRA